MRAPRAVAPAASVAALLAACAGVPPEPAEPGPTRVLFFVVHDCPIANGYAPEIAAIAAEHADRALRFELVYVDPDFALARAQAHAREYALPLQITLDGEHRLVHELGITVTPEVAVVRPDGEIAYRGRIDDLYGDLGKKRPLVRHHDLREAMRAILAGDPVAEPRTLAVGCPVPESP